ncbi:Protein of unknown function [Neorhodopirellula lusitana]|uniref:DUF2853 family protein n=1 Tax=Neorhodopirellula lusitana TaxID=445327 RepID=A0ABY1PU78_9BACT|nr:DUF2853 family protein [Neorhodopirellula lusitana]SMP48227.1 Protein of unknown function [Neorhodopirellula lusitana]
MPNYLENVKKYVDSPNENAVEALVGHLGLALQNRDSAVVAATDPEELASIKSGYCSKTLDLSDEETDKAMASVCEIMKGDRAKCRVAFYYLLAQESGAMDRLAAE